MRDQRGQPFFLGLRPDFHYDPSITYDLVVSNAGGNVTFSGALQYTSAPVLIRVDQCIDRGEQYRSVSGDGGPQCPAGTTITMRGSHFPAAEIVTAQYYRASENSPHFYVDLLNVTRIKSTTIAATMSVLDAANATVVYGAFGHIQVLFESGGRTTYSNMRGNYLYIPANTPSITSVTSSSCDTVSALQLANCHSLAIITIVGSNLTQSDDMVLDTSSTDGAAAGYNFLLPKTDEWRTWYNSLNDTTLVFTLDYFDGDTNVRLQPDVVYTTLLVAGRGGSLPSNAFRLRLTYAAAVVPTPPSSSTSTAASAGTATSAASLSAAATSAASYTVASSSTLSTGAVAGVVVAAVTMAALLAVTVVWLLRYRASGRSALWWDETAGEGWQRSMRSGGGGGDSSSEAYTDVELH